MTLSPDNNVAGCKRRLAHARPMRGSGDSRHTVGKKVSIVYPRLASVKAFHRALCMPLNVASQKMKVICSVNWKE
jgi:hypothetical protein